MKSHTYGTTLGMAMLTTPNETIMSEAAPRDSVWKPLLEGDLKRCAEDTVSEIAQALRGFNGTIPAGLASGAAGLAVLEHSLNEASYGSEEHAAERWLERAVGAMSAVGVTASLFGGLTGVGWAIEQLRPQLSRVDPDELNDEIDDLLCERLLQSPWRDEYDLVGGLVGYGVYALERLPRPAAVLCLERIVDLLAETAVELPQGVTWWSRLELLPDHQRKTAPNGYYNLGLAHGVPGVIAFLGQICESGVAVERARPLLDEAVRWLLAQRPADERGFGSWIEPQLQTPPEPARLAWCYGDPGIACALFLAARSVGELHWEKEAHAIACRAADCPEEKSGVKDAGLCHGAAGLGHLFNRLHQATGNGQFQEAALYWFEQTLDMKHLNRGIAGYPAWWGGFDGGPEWLEDVSLLTGAAGVALALLAACSDTEPNWDRMLLISIPPV